MKIKLYQIICVYRGKGCIWDLVSGFRFALGVWKCPALPSLELSAAIFWIVFRTQLPDL